MNPKYFIGPMSKNVVDSIVHFVESTNNSIAFIPSRRQIEFNGGYVNKWKTQEFSKYIKSKTSKIVLQRDHSGPGQGSFDDDGYESLKSDSQCLDLIHIDPWKKYPDYQTGLQWTVDMIKYCDSINPKLFYEVGTEEAIRRFEAEELDCMMEDLKSVLPSSTFSKIKYLVIQSGTSLKGNTQTGNYDRSRLENMLSVAKKYRVLSKEHNGDYIGTDIIKEKFSIGLDAINIAPEFGLIETKTYLKEIGNNNQIFDLYWKICYQSKKWEKWVDKSFDPIKQKVDLIMICGHYVLSDENFLKDVKKHFPNIDQKIKKNIENKLVELYA